MSCDVCVYDTVLETISAMLDIALSQNAGCVVLNGIYELSPNGFARLTSG
jgi:hypothetical protein